MKTNLKTNQKTSWIFSLIGHKCSWFLLDSVQSRVLGLLCLLMPLNHLKADVKACVVGSLEGQLGNQCFQIAAAFSHAWDHNATPLMPDLVTNPYYNISTNREKVFWRIHTEDSLPPIAFQYVEKAAPYAPIPYHANMQLKGYFQSEKYFRKHKEKIIDLFAPSTEILSYLRNKYSPILNHPKTVAIHYRSYLRGGLYHWETSMNEIYCDNGKEYFQKAISLFSKDALFVVFSNDITWCKENLHDLAKNLIFIENEPYYHDFYLMSLCKHQIISNSSFSWWAAYLNRNPDKIVIAPINWFTKASGFHSKDLFPDEWILQ